MTETVPRERLQPSLLDRLTDDDPGSVQEPVERRVLSRTQMRAAVLRDLTSLLNCTRLTDKEDLLAAETHAGNSVLNYGVPSFSGETAASIEISDIERAVRDAIVRFEPRILPDSLVVTAIHDDSMLDWHNLVSLRISGLMWAQPVPLELLIRTTMDLETGQVELSELRN
ncbi:type VI secretion system baseplate subunit TssE [Zoogloea dura]|uniref:Type VI secretion system baseplate subunit TssE n=1 Tax=Zoogloea dura TaxID=2728840 RepID=A0A848G2U3_9RHOO|nr:type VI secretion system baseplate subunit TssE [Zoogloea dura]NML24763.1 type VI secretion system baseplate subunit TssE [Zoogloea dura]